MKLEDTFEKTRGQEMQRALELEASLREAELRVEVLKRDKTMLLEDLDKAREKEKAVNSLWEGVYHSPGECNISHTVD